MANERQRAREAEARRRAVAEQLAASRRAAPSRPAGGDERALAAGIPPDPPRFPPAGNLYDRMLAITPETESGNRDVDERGRVVSSDKGARGKMQVRDKTNSDPGYGVRAARNDSLEERARVGRDYLLAMLHRYDDIPKAWAAYNMGPTKFDRLLAEHGRAWRAHLSPETTDYLRKNMAALAGEPLLSRAADGARRAVAGSLRGRSGVGRIR